ncbi:hypothetical protein CgS9114_11891 [Corynebacterium glutamicum S9114]|nr:hypothetical protein CgS9114_11891 [Corynebacterium glutamicum S9114]
MTLEGCGDPNQSIANGTGAKSTPGSGKINRHVSVVPSGVCLLINCDSVPRLAARASKSSGRTHHAATLGSVDCVVAIAKLSCVTASASGSGPINSRYDPFGSFSGTSAFAVPVS